MFLINSLFKRTVLLIISSLVPFIALFIYFSINSQNSALIDVMYSKANTIAKSIALVSADAMVTEDYSFLVEYNEKVLNDDEEIIYILITKDAIEGTTILSNKKGWKILNILPLELKNMNTVNKNAAILTTSISQKEEIYHFSYPVIFSGVQWGWVSIGYSVDKYNEHMQKIYFNSAFMLLATLFVSLLFSYVLAQWIVKPIVSLNSAAKRVANGDLDVEVKIDSKGEIGELASSFNHMVNTIKLSNKKLQTYNEELELRVNKRTDELSKLNAELDQRVKDEVHKRAEQEQILIQQSRFAAMGEMIGNIAHQWRQPLNALGLLLQNIENAYEMDMLDEAYVTRSVEKGNRLTNSMSQTIDDFRNFFKPNKESSVLRVISSVESTMGMLRSSIENSMITINEEIDESVSIKGFSSEFSQVILNILNNAKDALVENKEDDRQLYIKVFKDEAYAYVEIEDNAGGIPTDILEKIFDPYFTTKDEGKGTGIGLYMSKTIVENNMQGSLKVQNSEHGAKFTIKIKLEMNEGCVT